jgi:NADP-dependent 3-hydroxy acid dehydrogenase YdfG
VNDTRLDGQVALVTGASSGIGEGVAHGLAAAGATVVVAARRGDRLAKVAGEIEAAGGVALPLELDVTRDDDPARVVAEIRRRFGRLDGVVNSAGVMLSAKVADARVSDWRRMVEINLLGLMNVCHAALPLMRERQSGHFVNISSISARLANAGSPAYAASKSGVGAFSESLRKECSPLGIRVTLIMPGIVETELFTHVEDPATRARFGAMIESMTVLQPADIAAAALFAMTQPPHVSVNEMVIRPTAQVE